MVVGTPLILYSFGYRFSFTEWKWLRAGGLSISSVPTTGTKIYVDGKLIQETNLFSRTVFLQGLTPGSYTIAVTKDGFFNWSKKLLVRPEQVTDARALLVQESPTEGKVLRKGDYETLHFLDSSENTIVLTSKKGKVSYYSVSDDQLIPLPATKGTTSPELSENAKAFLQDKNPKNYDYDPAQDRIIWWDDHVVNVRWLRGQAYLPLYTEKEEETVLQSSYTIRGARFYPGQDSILVAYSNMIMVVELDGRDKRNEFPLYKGREPRIEISKSDKKAYLLDDGNLISIPIP